MLPLSQDYVEELEAIAGSIQDSDQLAHYQDTEEEEEYKMLASAFEPYIAELHLKVAKNDPLQLISFEQILIDPAFEGLYLPKILAYSVLRGDVNNFDCKYSRQQEHFKLVLDAILSSPNFEWLKKRIGQTVQIGFMLSSDIWITGMINGYANKRFRYYLQNNKIDRYRFEKERREAWTRYKKQFNTEIYFTTDFPTQFSELKVYYPAVKDFMYARVSRNLDNLSITEQVNEYITHPDFLNHAEHTEMLAWYANFFDVEGDNAETLKAIFNAQRTEDKKFGEVYFKLLLELLTSEVKVDELCDRRVNAILDDSISDELSEYYALMAEIDTKGYTSEEAITAVRAYHNNHEGLSVQNQCVRFKIFNNIKTQMMSFKSRDYHTYFELNKTMNVYMQVFGNQLFNQNIEDLSVAYVNASLKNFTDKRGKDYQEIKRFVATSFVDQGFLNEKDVTEMFKTRRKKKVEETKRPR
jgi:hypothetical protein